MNVGDTGTTTGEIGDPYPEFARLRQTSPVVQQESAASGAPSIFVVYRHADVTKVLRDAVTFSSVLMAQGMAEVWGRKIIVGMDAPEHHRHRALVSSAFRQSTLARWEDSLVRRVVNELIDQFCHRGEADLVNEYTFPFPAKVRESAVS
jgi:cytochrome P450